MPRWTPLLLLTLAACQAPVTDEDTDTTDTDAADTDAPDTDVADTDTTDTDATDTDAPDYVALGFSVDDRANQTYTLDDGLAWKGSLALDPVTQVVSFDPSWAGPFPMLYDDGPVQSGGHEPHDAVVNDHIWGVSVPFESPAADQDFEYGAIRGSVAGLDGEWIWSGPNGSFTVPAHATGFVAAPSLVIPAFGVVDLKLTLDASGNGAQLAPDYQGVAYSNVAVKGSAWGWREVSMTDDGTAGDAVAADGVYTFVLSNAVGPHEGLLFPGDTPQFVFVLDGTEYRVSGDCPNLGVGAVSDSVTPGVWAEEAVENDGGTGNSVVVVGP